MLEFIGTEVTNFGTALTLASNAENGYTFEKWSGDINSFNKTWGDPLFSARFNCKFCERYPRFRW